MKRKKKVVLNIGLNNNPLTPGEIVDRARRIFGLKPGEFMEYKVSEGTYHDSPEDTLVLRLICSYKLSTVTDKIERAAAVMNQDCIGAKIDGNGVLIYRENYKEPRQSFNPKYFTEL